MKTALKQPSRTRRWILGTPALLLCVGSAKAQEAPEPGATKAPLPAIAANAAIPEAKLTMEARRLPLSQVLAVAKQQAGVDLSIAEGTFAREPKVTMAVSAMPLREWMESLASLYDVSWQGAGPNAFRLQPSGISQEEKGLKHMGTWFNAWGWAWQDAKRPDYLPPRVVPEWRAMVDDNLNLQAATTVGVPFSDAPAELQQAIRKQVEEDIAPDLLLDARILIGAMGPLSINIARSGGGRATILNAGQRNERRIVPPTSLSAEIKDAEGYTIGRFDLLAKRDGSELLRDGNLFPHNPRLPIAPPK